MEPTATHADILAFEHKFWEAMKNLDVDSALALTDATCLLTGAQGASSFDHKTLTMMLNNAHYTLHVYDITKAVTHFPSPDTALIAYHVHEEMTYDGEPITLDAADASVWVRRNGTWVCSMHTESILGDPFGRDRKGK